MVELKDKDHIMSKQSVGSSSPLACIAVRPDKKPYTVTASVNRASCEHRYSEKFARSLLTINLQWLLCTVIKFHFVEEAIQSSSSIPFITNFNVF